MLLKPHDRFKFKSGQIAVMVASIFGNWLGYHVPDKHYCHLVNPQLLGERRIISVDEVFIARESYMAIGGWCVVAISESDHDRISLMQFPGGKDVRGMEFDPDDSLFVKVEIVSGSVAA